MPSTFTKTQGSYGKPLPSSPRFPLAPVGTGQFAQSYQLTSHTNQIMHHDMAVHLHLYQ